MSLKILIPTVGVAAVVFSSCAPLTPYRTQPGVQPAMTAEQRAAEAQAAEQKNIEDAQAKARREAEKRKDALNGGSGSATNGGSGGGSTNTTGKPDYRRAIPIPGKEGFVFNPFTNNPVDVRGIPSGTLVRDPQDPNKAHKFRVP